jgi:hypothetical protein
MKYSECIGYVEIRKGCKASVWDGYISRHSCIDFRCHLNNGHQCQNKQHKVKKTIKAKNTLRHNPDRMARAATANKDKAEAKKKAVVGGGRSQEHLCFRMTQV